MGLLIGIKVADAGALMNACFEKGLLVVTAGTDDIRILPPLNVSTEDIDAALDILEDVMAEVYRISNYIK